LFDDTWEWDGTSWQLRATGGPSSRYGHRMAYDAARGVTVLFGGRETNRRTDDTWEWDGASWALRDTPGPSKRQSHAMAYDTARGVIVLYSGGGGGDTWELAPFRIRGDLNCDCVLDGADIDPFFLAVGEPAAYGMAYPRCDEQRADVDGNGAVNGADIDAFFRLLGHTLD
jgi:hypothetical protein